MPARRAAGKHAEPREVAMSLPHLIDMNPRPIMLGRWLRTLRHKFATVPKNEKACVAATRIADDDTSFAIYFHPARL
jgi:hypothetical protein